MMDDVKHTPGSWVVSKIGLMNDGGRPVVTDDVRVAIACAITEPSKARDAWQHNCPEREANARLIAAAPDMLEALIRFRAKVYNAAIAQGMAHDWATDACAMADAAIAKATGGV